jgi:DNA-directed RNA polymerase subunit RPC12/RpoP
VRIFSTIRCPACKKRVRLLYLKAARIYRCPACGQELQGGTSRWEILVCVLALGLAVISNHPVAALLRTIILILLYWITKILLPWKRVPPTRSTNCLQCGYDLFGQFLAGGEIICPECGLPHSPAPSQLEVRDSSAKMPAALVSSAQKRN